MRCLKESCQSPVACGGFGYCRELNMRSGASLGPAGPLRKDDGPACRVCGCTENNACLIGVPVHIAARMQAATPKRSVIGCSWKPTTYPKEPPLCSACSGTAADMAETIERGCGILLKHRGVRAADLVVAMAKAAKVRYEARRKLESQS